MRAPLLLVLVVAVLAGAVPARAGSPERSPREIALAAGAARLAAAGQPAAAEARWLEAVKLREAATTPEDPSLLPLLRALAVAQAAQGRRADALGALRRGLPIAEDAIARARLAFSEARLAGMLDYLRTDDDLIYSLAAQAPSDRDAGRLAMTVALLRKARLLEELRRTYSVLHDAALSGEDAAAWQRLRDLKRRLAMLALLTPERKAEIAALGRDVRRLEDQLAASTALGQYAAGTLAMNTNVDLAVEAVALGVGLSHVYVEIVSFRRYDFGAAGRPGRWKGREYLVMVMRSDAEVNTVALGPAAPIDAEIKRLLKTFADPAAAHHLRVAQDAYRRLVAPYRKHFDYPDIAFTNQTVSVSPDGEFNLVPFGALHDGQRYLLAAYNFVYVAAGREAGLLAHRADGVSRRVLILADPDFRDSVPTALGKPSVELELLRLRGTRKEAAAIAQLVPQAEVVLDRKATPRAMTAPPAPSVLHVASHGVFVEATPAAPAEWPADGPSAADDLQALTRLARAGLALAGEDGGGGIVTALEIMEQDLRGTQLVVLSACETGRGDIRAGEGVYGLRRAFFAAGAETVVMSLWKVEDTATAALMTSFYTRLRRGETPAQAMRGAADDVRSAHAHPFFWAPFIVVGRTGRIAALAAAP